MTAAPILIDLPEYIEGQRVVLRAPRPGDGPVLNETIMESWDSLHTWLHWAKKLPTVEESEETARRLHASFCAREDLSFFIFLNDRRTLLGGTGLHRIDWSVPRFEIGYWGRTAFEGRGYMSEAVRTLADFAFTHLGALRVEIRCSHRNERSQRVAERCGFSLEGRLRNQARDADGRVRDTFVYSRVADVPK